MSLAETSTKAAGPSSRSRGRGARSSAAATRCPSVAANAPRYVSNWKIWAQSALRESSRRTRDGRTFSRSTRASQCSACTSRPSIRGSLHSPWRSRDEVRCGPSSWVQDISPWYTIRASLKRPGEVAEWSNAPDSKSGVRFYRTVGSNPTLSAKDKFEDIPEIP